MVRLGGWLFERRTSTPLPIMAVLLVVRAGEAPYSPALLAAGILVVAAGESLRLWAVHHIGAISRTRSDRLGPLVSTGPFALVRNPLYLGNIALWVGFALSARLVWMVPVVVLVLGFEYHAIVRWEERLLASRRGEEYLAYTARVPRWLPNAYRRERSAVAFSWRDTLFSERGTLLAIAAGFLLLWMKLSVLGSPF
jgi:protein-S-isoprenylcysteine O-methyltransferase Ste14